MQHTDTLLDVARLEKVGQGQNRDVYVIPRGHPQVAAAENKSLVLKVPRYSERAADQSAVKRLLRRLFPKSAERVITKEAQYRQKLARAAGQTAIPVPAFCGFIATDHGRGALWEAICDDTGALAPTLDQCVKKGQTALFLAPLNTFVHSCFALNLVGPDINDRNLVLAHTQNGAEVILIDGFGDHRMVSMRTLWPPRNRRSLHNRFSKVARKTGLVYDPNLRLFSLPD